MSVEREHDGRDGSNAKRNNGSTVEVIRNQPCHWRGKGEAPTSDGADGIPPIPTVPTDGRRACRLQVVNGSYWHGTTLVRCFMRFGANGRKWPRPLSSTAADGQRRQTQDLVGTYIGVGVARQSLRAFTTLARLACDSRLTLVPALLRRRILPLARSHDGGVHRRRLGRS